MNEIEELTDDNRNDDVVTEIHTSGGNLILKLDKKKFLLRRTRLGQGSLGSSVEGASWIRNVGAACHYYCRYSQFWLKGEVSLLGEADL
jgi:hypothetical protein